MTVEIITALDYPDAKSALEFVDSLGDGCTFFKVGLELFVAGGPPVVAALRDRGKRVFLDLKFHDIPNTVGAAARSAATLGASLITVHASGGRAMLQAAVAGAAEGSEESGVRCKVLGVSVLTSLGSRDLGEAWGRSGVVSEQEEVLRLARLAQESALDGLVCSAHEAARVRSDLGGTFELLVPGIRLEGGDAHDQLRVATPAAARDAGADYLVLGRAITRAADPVQALRAVLAALTPRLDPAP